MESIYKDRIDEIINSGLSINKINGKLGNLIDESKRDSYVLYRTSEYRIANGLGRYKKLLDELTHYDEYYQYAYYYLGQICYQVKDYKTTMDYYSKIIYQDGTYADMARKIYAKLLFKREMYNELLKLLEYTEGKGLVNESIYYYSSKVYIIRNECKEAIRCLEEAIKIEPDNMAFHDKLRYLYNSMHLRTCELNEINKLLELGSKNKETLLRSRIVCLYLLDRNHELVDAIRDAKEFGIESNKDDKQLFHLLFKYSDYAGVEELSKEIISKDNMTISMYSELMRMYLIENLCDKSLNVYEEHKPENDDNLLFLYGKANVYLQKGEYNEAKKIAYQIIKDSPRSATFARFLALCLFLEKNYNDSKKIMKLVDPDSTRLDIYLRHELGILDSSIFKQKPLLVKLLQNYNYEDVKKDLEHRFGGNVRDIRFNDDINIGSFTDDMNYIVSNIKPSYSADKAVYLIDYGKEVASIHGKQTSRFIIDTLPDGKLITYRPVIATADAIKENKYVRVR